MNQRLARMQRGLVTLLAGCADVVTWGHAGQPREAGSILTCLIEASDSRVLERRSLLPVTNVELLVTEATEGALAWVSANGMRTEHTAAAGDSVTDVRDALVAKLDALDPDLFGASAVSVDRLELDGTIWNLTAGGVLTIGASDVSASAVQVTRTRETYQITIEAYSRETEPRLGAHAIISEARKRLHDSQRLAALGNDGVARWLVGDVIDLSAIAGPRWESRSRFVVQFAVPAVDVQPVHPIEQVDLEIAVSA